MIRRELGQEGSGPWGHLALSSSGSLGDRAWDYHLGELSVSRPGIKGRIFCTKINDYTHKQ